MQINFVADVVSLDSAKELYTRGYPHDGSEYYWVFKSSGSLERNKDINPGWNIYTKKYLDEIGFNIHYYFIESYPAPTSEEILLWKLRVSK